MDATASQAGGLPPKRPSRVLVRGIGAIVVVAGWIVFAASLCALVVEKGGLLEHWIESELAARLGPDAGELTLSGADVSWSTRTVHLAGLEFRDLEEELFVERVDVIVGWSPLRGPFVERAIVESGRVRISPALITAWERLVAQSDDDFDPDGPFATLAVRDLSIQVETPEWGNLPIGRLDACFQPGADGRPRLTGRLVPELEGAGDSGTVYLTGRLGEEGVLEVRGAARALPLASSFLPEDPALDIVRQLDPHALFDLEMRGRYVLGEDVLPRIEAVLALTDGRLRLPWIAEEDDAWVEDVQVRVAGTFDSSGTPSLWDRDAWSGTMEAQGRWSGWEGDGRVAELRARMVRHARDDEAFAEAWLRVPELALDANLLDLAGHPDWLLELWQMLDPGGSAELLVGMRLPSDWAPGDGILEASERAIVVRLDGRGETAYVGGPNEDMDGARNLGFPLPLAGVSGAVTFLHRPGREFPDELGLFDLQGDHEGHVVRALGSGFFVPFELQPLPGSDEPPPNIFHLVASSPGLPVNEQLRAGFAGLVGLGGCQRIWSEYGPESGALGFRLELWHAPGDPLLASRVDVDFQDVGLRWEGFPLRADVNGSFAFLGDGRRERGRSAVTVNVTGSSEAARRPLHVTGRAEFGPGDTVLASWDVDTEEVNLRSSDLREVLAEQHPDVLAEVDRAEAAGWIDAHFTSSQSGDDAWTWLEVHTADRGVHVQPRMFPMDTREVLGRLIAVSPFDPDEDAPAEEPLVDVRFGVSGRWGGGAGAPVWAAGRFPPDGPGTILAYGAGLDVDNPAVLGALETAMSTARDKPVQFDLTDFDFGGHLDFAAELTLPEVEGGELLDSRFALQARLDRFGVGGVSMLKKLHGRLTYSQQSDEWVGERLSGIIGTTPVLLTDLHFRGDDVTTRLVTRLTAEGLPVDREHLLYFLDELTLRTLLEEFEARGWFDIEGALLTIESNAEGETSLRFNGAMALHDVFIRLGLPVSIRSTEDVDIDLYYEGDRVRARARVRELYGQVAGRSLDQANLQLTYIEPRLTIEELHGKFEDGVLRSLGQRASSTAGFFSIDLEEPYPFSLAAEMDDVDVGQLLLGVFNSDFANEGRLDATFRLDGDIGRLTEIRGGGRFEIADSGLWAIPVFQALFSKLGFDTTATFSNLESRYRIADGVVDMTNMRLKSDLLSLVGDGAVDFNGKIAHDLEVRYSIVDRLGPLTRLVYYVQNSLLRISIRGDMSRPEVVVKGLISGFFAPPKNVQRLPLPGYGELPRRF